MSEEVTPQVRLLAAADHAINGRPCVVPRDEDPALPSVEHLGITRMWWSELCGLHDASFVTIVDSGTWKYLESHTRERVARIHLEGRDLPTRGVGARGGRRPLAAYGRGTGASE